MTPSRPNKPNQGGVMGLDGPEARRPLPDSGMTLRAFHNGLRILTSIDMRELVVGKVIEADDKAEWDAFRKDPHKWLILADDDEAAALWAVMKARGA